MGEFTPEQEAAALAQCEQEPAPIPDRVQGFVDLIGFEAERFEVCVETSGAGARLGLNVPSDDSLLGKPLEEVLTDGTIRHAIRNAMSSPVARSHRERVGSFRVGGATREIGLYVRDGVALLEVETPEGPPEQPGEAVSRVRAMMTVLGDAESLPAMLKEATRVLRAFSGFDRVMVYRFVADGGGEVVAESCAVGTEAFLGLRFPATDIPPQARALMRRVPFRMIPDIDAAHRPVRCAAGVRPDLSFLHGRGVSPVHAEYMRKMGVPGTMNIALVVGGALWGMFAFHHGQPRRLSPTDRTVAELFSELFAVEVQQREEAARLSRLRRVRSTAHAFVHTAEPTPGALMARHWADTLRCVDADGVAVLAPAALDAEAPACFGSTPPVAAVKRLAAVDQAPTLLVDGLGDLPSLHGVDTGPSAGVMQLDLGGAQETRLLFFRDEAVRSVRWAGKPEKTIVVGPSGPRLSPRGSFAAYAQSVRGRCRPWVPEDMAAAQELRSAVVQACFDASRQSESVLRQQKRTQELLVAELNHRVKNILALVRSIADQTRDSAASLDEYATAFARRIGALASAHDLAGGSGDQWPPLSTLLRAELGAFEGGSPKLEWAGPTARLRPDVAPLMALMLHEMVTNAAKHGALRGGGALRVDWKRRDGGLALSWRETLGADRPTLGEPTRRGFGMVLIDRAVAYECGGESRVTFGPTGLRVEIWIPGDRVRFDAEDEDAGPEAAPEVAPTVLPASSAAHPALACVLVAEDRAMLAIEMEKLMREMGAQRVHCVPSADAATRLLDRADAPRPTFAVLDVHLGNWTSLPLASRLHAVGVPIVFVTGYGRVPNLPEELRAVPRLSKPVDPEALWRVIEALPEG